MPRRSKRVVTPIHDEIEEDEPTPNRYSAQDADAAHSTDDRVPEQTSTMRSKKSKSKSRAAAIESVDARRADRPRDASEGRVSEGPVPFDRVEFLATERPIPPESVKAIDGVMSDLQTIIHELEHTGFGLVLDTAVAVEEVSGNANEDQEATNELDLVMRQLVDAQQELKIHQDSLDLLKQGILREEVLNGLADLYTKYVSDAMQIYNSRTTRQRYAKHKGYFKFRDRVWEVNHDNAMPPLRDVLPREDADSDVGSDIEVGGMTQDYRCPITLRPLTDPLTSKVCGHSFSAEAIREYITNGRGRTSCPATGCNQVLRLVDLEPNEELAQRAAGALRRAQRREDIDENEAEVVE